MSEPTKICSVFPEDAQLGANGLDIISDEEAPTLSELFSERVKRSPEKIAYRDFDPIAKNWRSFSWRQVQHEVARWQEAFAREGLRAGDHLAIRMRNCALWPVVDQAALGMGIVVVPLYVKDRADNVTYILDHAEIRLLVLESADQWHEIAPLAAKLTQLRRVVIEQCPEPVADDRVSAMNNWLPDGDYEYRLFGLPPDSLATIMYTSGTTGRPKGVMLSHRNIVMNASQALHSIAVFPHDLFLSFLPLSHTLERTAGYYLPMMAGSEVAYARSIPELAEDLLTIRPTLMAAVPRIFERVYGKIMAQSASSAIKSKLVALAAESGWRSFEIEQGRASWAPICLPHGLLDGLVGAKVRAGFGGRLRFAICGGAPLPPAISRFFIGLGINLVQGYGLTESSPVITVNTLSHNMPSSIGLPLRGLEVRIGERDELLARGPSIMKGYWKNEQATRDAIDVAGWLHTGDRAKIDERGFVHIIGRIKEIIVLANGEKVPPSDMESAICEDPLFAQSLVIGEGMPFLSAIVVLEPEVWRLLANDQGLPGDPTTPQAQALIRQRLLARLKQFPGYAQIHQITTTLEPWSIDNGLLTPTLKLKRQPILTHFATEVERMYKGHLVTGKRG